jgi:hypothetical protein
MTDGTRLTGGCQCGAVRFACEELGRASICHCRMCQTAFGNFFGALVEAIGLVWTRGKPERFRSSNEVQRGFCAACGTPLSYEADNTVPIWIAIGALDDPAVAKPSRQVGREAQMPWVDDLSSLHGRPADEDARLANFFAGIRSFQHPDHDTPVWPPARSSEQ